MGEKLFYYLEEPNIGGVSLLSFLFYFYFEPDPYPKHISFICWASSFCPVYYDFSEVIFRRTLGSSLRAFTW